MKIEAKTMYYIKNNINGKEHQGEFTKEELKEIMEETPYPYDIRIRSGIKNRVAIWINEPKETIKVWGVGNENRDKEI